MFGSQSSVRSSVRVTRRPGGESSHIDGIFGFDRRPSAAAPAPAEPSAKPAADAATSTDGLEGLASSFFSMGLNTLKIPMSLHAENRFRLLNAFSGSDVPRNSFILLEGARDVPHHSEDTDYPFKQESYFLWAFGVAEPDFNGLIDVDERRAILFCPRFPQEYAVWMGKIQPPSHFRDKYGVDEALYADELDSYLAARDPSALYVLKGLNTDSGRYVKPASFPGIEKYRVDDGRLFPVATECRVVKSAKEIEVMRYVCKVSSEAHTEVMKWVRPGAMEYQAESIFLHECYSRGGCRFTGYTCICCAGETGAVLHYGHAGAPNNRPIADGDMCLFDMGAEYHGYTADITVSFPASGKFSADQRLVYGAVLAAVKAVEAAVKPGVSWPEMHRLAERTMLEALAKGGLLKGSVEEMMAAHLGATFMPHGLGHLLGLAVHDVGGYPKGGPERPKEPGICKLRTARPLLAGMVITVEPGIYFIDHLLDAALADPAKAKHIVPEALARFRGFGGVRLEDDVLVTDAGCEVLSSVPREMDEIEAIMAAARAGAGGPAEKKD